MPDNQLPLFSRKHFPAVSTPSPLAPVVPTAESTVMSTLVAYRVYVSSFSESKHTPRNFCSDVKKFALFVRDKKIQDIDEYSIREWIEILQSPKGEGLQPKTVSRKISALHHYFLWLALEKGISFNPMERIGYKKVVAPLPDILFEQECQLLLQTASSNPRTYLLFLLLLETGIKTEELFMLKISNFDFSNKYKPEVWIKHTGKKIRKNRKLKLPTEIGPVFAEYIKDYRVTDRLFPYSERFMRMLIAGVAKEVNIQKKVSAQILRDSYAVRCLRRGEHMETLLAKLGLSASTWEDAEEKYQMLSRGAI